MEVGLAAVRAAVGSAAPIARLALSKMSVLAPLSVLGVTQLSEEVSTEVAIYAALALCWLVVLPMLYAHRDKLFQESHAGQHEALKEEWLKSAWDPSRDAVIDMDRVHDIELSAAELYYGPELKPVSEHLETSTASNSSSTYERFVQDSDQEPGAERRTSGAKRSSKTGSKHSGAHKTQKATSHPSTPKSAAPATSDSARAPKQNAKTKSHDSTGAKHARVCSPSPARPHTLRPESIVSDFRAIGLELV
mmetsp:Transcript_14897/g.39912  ORF Transcript_14897/g.39912 Transcript_14897/m.39912 type:complete len:249 (+) Transcript_14897:279-1025(+)